MQRDNKNESVQNTGLYIFECVMAVLYLAMAFILLFTPLFEDTISGKSIRLALGILLGVYGIYRAYRAIKKFRKRNEANI